MRLLLCFCLLLIKSIGIAQRYDVVIHEIFADPSPAVALPGAEWIELRNRSTQPIQLQGWRLSDGGGTSGSFPTHLLPPDSMLIVCANTNGGLFNNYGRCIGIANFPSLDNDGELLVLRDAVGQVIHAISYAASWHQTELKKEGGWSLEMIDPRHPGLFQKNWRSSTHPSGGTPGKINSQNAELEDRDPPMIHTGYSLDSSRLLICFDEAMDSVAMSWDGLFHLSEGREIVEAKCLPPLYDRVELRTDWPLLKEKIYTLTNVEATDLSGNSSEESQSIRIGIPSSPDLNDIRINELLFDPPVGGSDYIELINKGKKIIDLSGILLSARAANGNLGTIRRVVNEPWYFFPEDHLVITADKEALLRHYFVQQPNWVIESATLPSLPNTDGNIVVLNNQGEVLDELNYASGWHFPLLQTTKGVSLERIDPALPTQEKNNWQSAASSVRYGTPTQRNSQYRVFSSKESIELSSAVLSPDGDGRDDILQIKFQSDEPACRLRLRVAHSSGVMVRELANLALAGTESVFNWDGLNDQGKALPPGRYILLAEVVRPNGKRTVHKKIMHLWSRN